MRPLPRATARSLQLLELRLGSHAAPGEGGEGGEGAEGGAGGEGAARVPRVVPREPDPVRRVWVRPAHVALQGQSAPPPLAAPQLGSCASPGRAWWLWAARHSQGGSTRHTGVPAPDAQLLELPAHPTAY